jgi:hypothetical protein
VLCDEAERKDRRGGKKALAHSRAIQMVVHGYGDKDICLVGLILAAKGHCALNTRDIASMGIPDPGGEKYHQNGWGSNDGLTKKKAEHWVATWVHITKALNRNTTTAMGPFVAWNQIKHCE